MKYELRKHQQLRPLEGGHHFHCYGLKFTGETLGEVVGKVSSYRLNNLIPMGRPEQEVLAYYADKFPWMVDAAEDETVEIFDQEDDNLEDIQDEAQDYADEIDERHESGESDLEKLSDASSEVRTAETINELANAKTSTLEEMDFLKDNNQKAEDAKAESEQAQQILDDRINSGRRS